MWVTQDMDKDSEPEILATDYSNRGRNHVFGLVNGNTLELIKNLFAPQNIGVFRTNRETGEVYDVDGDGRDELLPPNRDGKV